MSVEQNSFITNRDRFLSEVINGILPKCSSVDILVGYFYYFKELIKTYALLTKEQREGKKSEDDVKREANKIAKTIRSIISPLVVRRSRLDLEEIPEYKEALKITHRAKSARKCDKTKTGVLLFGKKGNDFVFKLGDSTLDVPTMLTAEQAISLFEAKPQEKAFETSERFDAIYQNVKQCLSTAQWLIRTRKSDLMRWKNQTYQTIQVCR